MAAIVRHVSLVPVAGLDYGAHISSHYGPSVYIVAMDTLGLSFTCHKDEDSRTVICLQADESDRQALDAAVNQGLAAWGAVELTTANDPDAAKGLLTVSAKLQPAATVTQPQGVHVDYTAPIVDPATGKLTRTVTPI